MNQYKFLKGIKSVFLLCMVFVFLVSCKTTKNISSGEIDGSLSTKKIIDNHYNNGFNFKTLSGRIKIDYSDGSTSQGVTVSFRMKKDEIVWISAPLGMVKAHITPDKVSFYNKLEGEYFEGDYGYLSNFLGIELDFQKLQNVLMGQALIDLREQKYFSEINDNLYELTPKKLASTLRTLFMVEPLHFKISEQQLTQPLEQRFLQVNYMYQSLDQEIIPSKVSILVVEKESQNDIILEYKGMELDKNLNFPYKIPKEYKKITLD